MLKSSLCHYSDAYMHVKGTLTIPNMAAAGAAPNNRNENVIFKIYAPFTAFISEINNTQFDVVMPMHNLIEYSDIRKHQEADGNPIEMNHF